MSNIGKGWITTLPSQCHSLVMSLLFGIPYVTTSPCSLLLGPTSPSLTPTLLACDAPKVPPSHICQARKLMYAIKIYLLWYCGLLWPLQYWRWQYSIIYAFIVINLISYPSKYQTPYRYKFSCKLVDSGS